MDESKIELPAWLPWATTACLAALVACLGELWILEKTRTQLLREEAQMVEASLKSLENQLEAERIVGSRELGQARRSAPQSGLNLELLTVPATSAGAVPANRCWGGVLWTSSGQAWVRLSGWAPKSDRAYQLWIRGPGAAYPSRCGLINLGAGSEQSAALQLSAPMKPGCSLVITEGPLGGSATPESAEATGSIVLASLPYTGKISN